MMDMIATRGLEYRYDSEDGEARLVLDGVELGIDVGSFVAVVGHNGSGKSTLAKHFNALLLPTGGIVLVREMNTADESSCYEIRRMVGMVLQNPDNQLVSTIVEEDVAFGPENIGVPPAEIRQRVDDALNAVGMYEYRTHAPHKLSGGQKQRVTIAGILAMQPDCIVLDEPTAMLDPQGRREVLDTIQTLNREQGMTVVLITHYMEEAAQAERVIVMDSGHVHLDGTPREVFAQVEVLRAVGLDVPPATELCWHLRQTGVSLPQDVLNVEECIEAIYQLSNQRIHP